MKTLHSRLYQLADQRAEAARQGVPGADLPLVELRAGQPTVPAKSSDVGFAIADGVHEGTFQAPVFTDLRAEIAPLARLDKPLAVLAAVLTWLDDRAPHIDPTKAPASETIRKLADVLLEESRRRGRKRSAKEPPKLAFDCWRLSLLQGYSQPKIAVMLTEERGKTLHQGTVSTYIRTVQEYLDAGNTIPTIEQATVKPTMKTVDPRKLDYQEKPDGRTRPRKSPLQEGGPPED